MNQELIKQLLKTCKRISHLKKNHAQILRQLNVNVNVNENENISNLLFNILPIYAFFSPSHFTPLLSSLIHIHDDTNFNSALFNFNVSIKYFSKNPFLSVNSLRIYRHMTRFDVKPDNYTYPVLLNSCTCLFDVNFGSEVHCRIAKTGFYSFLEVGNALINFYGKCGYLGCARKVFDEMPVRDVVSYNAVLGAYAKIGSDMGRARVIFDGMPIRDLISWNAMLVGYVNCGELGLARKLFDVMPERNVVSWTTVLVGYTKKGMMDKARVLFDDMPGKTLVCWTAIISGFSQGKQAEEALEYFRRMQDACVKPDAFTMTAVISALAQIGCPELANWISTVVDRERVERNERVLSSLAHMHAKCGNIEEAFLLFHEIRKPDRFAYSALITGLASNGHEVKALAVFRKMIVAKVEPDFVTFVGVLSACSHAGLVEEGLRHWESMINDYKIEPNEDHYACFIDMLGRAGRLEQAFKMLQSLPKGPCPGALGSLLAACRTYNNVEIAELVAKELFTLEPENTGNYVLLSSIYAAREQWDMAASVRSVMKEKINAKLPGCSILDDNRYSETRILTQG